MTMVYGGCIEPEGMNLENEVAEHDCHGCGKSGGRTRYWEEAEGGSLNSYSHTYCFDCDYESGEIPFDEGECYDRAALYKAAGLDELLEGQAPDIAAPPLDAGSPDYWRDQKSALPSERSAASPAR